MQARINGIPGTGSPLHRTETVDPEERLHQVPGPLAIHRVVPYQSRTHCLPLPVVSPEGIIFLNHRIPIHNDGKNLPVKFLGGSDQL